MWDLDCEVSLTVGEETLMYDINLESKTRFSLITTFSSRHFENLDHFTGNSKYPLQLGNKGKNMTPHSQGKYLM